MVGSMSTKNEILDILLRENLSPLFGAGVDWVKLLLFADGSDGSLSSSSSSLTEPDMEPEANPSSSLIIWTEVGGICVAATGPSLNSLLASVL